MNAHIRKFMFMALLTLLTPPISWAEGNVAIDVLLSPAGSFKAETNQVIGFAYKTAEGFAAENIVVDLRQIKTGVSLRDKHTKEHLMVEKYPEAKLINASGKNGVGTGLMDIRGVKQKVDGTYKVEGNNLMAQFKMHLPDLKIDKIRYMGVGVKDDVTVNVTVPIKAAPAAAGKAEK